MISEEPPTMVYVSAQKRLCPHEGSFPYEGDCTRFYKCKKGHHGRIQGKFKQITEITLIGILSSLLPVIVSKRKLNQKLKMRFD